MPKISQLPTLTNITTGSIIPVVESSLTQKLTVGKLFEFLSGALDQTFATEVELLRSASSITSSFNEFASASTLSIAEKLITSSFESLTASFNSFSSSINISTASLNSYTASNDSLNNTQNERLNELQSTSASFNSYTSSNDNKWGTLGALTGSLATTGSNTFNGNQTINGIITLDNNSVVKDTANQSISFGVAAAESGQGTQSTAIGSNAGQTDQGNGATALGALAGNLEQGQSAVSIGALAGSTQQGDWAIAIGAQAGGISQGNYSIALGNLAGGLNQAPNSVVINATGTQLDNTTTSSLKIAPIRINDDGSENVLVYNTTTKEVSYSVDKFATTGSNRFNGNQIITGSIDLTGFPLTASFLRLNGGNGSSNEDNFHQIRFDYRYDSGSRALGAGGFSHFITTRHFPGVNSNNNALDVYLNNSVGQYSSTAWNTGSKLGVAITAAGIGVLKTNPNSALDINGNLIVSGTIISTLNSLISGSFQITNLGFATTSSNTFKASQTIDGNLFLSGSNRLLYNNSDVNSLLFGFFDGSSIYGPYYQIFGNNYSTVSQRGSAEFVYDTRNGGESGFNIASFNGTSWTRKLRVDDSGVFVSGTLVATTSISGSIQATNNVISSSTQISESGFVSSSTINVIQTITSASYAGITPVSGTLYIIIG